MNNVVMWAVVAVAALILLTSFMRGGGDRGAVVQLVKSGAKLLDVRTPGEFANGHIRGAVNIPVQVLSQRLSELGSKDQDIVVYCRSGARSSHAKRLLNNAGYERVHDLGAMGNWPAEATP